IGSITVLVKLHPAVVGVHMLVSLGLVVASAALLALEPRTVSGADDGAHAPTPRTLLLSRVLLVVGGVLMVLGILTTGTGPHGGDEEHAYRYEFDPVLAAKAHAWAVWVFVALLVAILVLLHRERAPRRALRTWWTLVAITLAQGLIGYVQYFTGLPAILVGAHMLGTRVLASPLTGAAAAARPSSSGTSREVARACSRGGRMPRSRHRAALALLGLSALLGMLAACSPGTSAPSPAASESAPAAAFTLSSTDF